MGKGNLNGGRPRWELLDEEFEKIIAMMRIQCTQDEICEVYGVDEKTLNRRLAERGEGSFSACYKKHSGQGKMSLRRMQWRAAEEGNSTMLVWLGKQVLGQRDKIDHDNTSTDGSLTPPSRIIIEAAGIRDRHNDD